MEEKPNRTTLWTTAVAALPFLYVLSIGPVSWVLDKQLHMTTAPNWYHVFYGPLGWAMDHWPAFKSLMEIYGKLWGLGP